MPYTFAPPTETKREKNPAQELLDWISSDLARPLGETYLSCDGVGVENLMPAVPKYKVAQSGSGYKIGEILPVTHNFTSKIVIPPAPENNEYWRSSITSWTFLNNLAAKLPKKGIFRQETSYLTGTVRLIPKPSVQEFYQHILCHERQHVADNLWAVQSVFGPWHLWLEKVYKAHGEFTFKNKETIEWFLGGGVYPVMYGKYLFDLCNEIGIDFHKNTDEGAAPIYAVANVSDGMGFHDGDRVLNIEISAKKLIKNMTWNGDPHKKFNLKSMQQYSDTTATQVLDGPPTNMIPLSAMKTPELSQSDIDKKEKPDDEDSGAAIGFFD